MLRRGGPMTRDEICAATGLKVSTACARIRDLECPDRHAPAMLAASPLVRKCGRKRAASGVRVWTYELTDEGRRA